MTYLKVVTPQLLLHYANYMKEHGYWEEAFKVYQQGVQLFHWPLVHDIWVAYIAAFVSRFKGRKMERMRDMFEQCLKDVPKKYAYTLGRRVPCSPSFQCSRVWSLVLLHFQPHPPLQACEALLPDVRSLRGALRAGEAVPRHLQTAPPAPCPRRRCWTSSSGTSV